MNCVICGNGGKIGFMNANTETGKITAVCRRCWDYIRAVPANEPPKPRKPLIDCGQVGGRFAMLCGFDPDYTESCREIEEKHYTYHVEKEKGKSLAEKFWDRWFDSSPEEFEERLRRLRPFRSTCIGWLGAKDLKPGDRVRLKGTDGPDMTVTASLNSGMTTCAHFEGDKFVEHTIDRGALIMQVILVQA